MISTGNTASYRELDLDLLLKGNVTIEVKEEKEDANGEIVEEFTNKEFSYAELAHYSTATVKNLTVKSVHTTNTDTESKGALTITCQDEHGNTFKIRTASKLTKEVGGQMVDVTAADFPAGTVISAKGIIDFYMDSYQLKVFSFSDITFE